MILSRSLSVRPRPGAACLVNIKLQIVYPCHGRPLALPGAPAAGWISKGSSTQRLDVRASMGLKASSGMASDLNRLWNAETPILRGHYTLHLCSAEAAHLLSEHVCATSQPSILLHPHPTSPCPSPPSPLRTLPLTTMQHPSLRLPLHPLERP